MLNQDWFKMKTLYSKPGFQNSGSSAWANCNFEKFMFVILDDLASSNKRVGNGKVLKGNLFLELSYLKH